MSPLHQSYATGALLYSEAPHTADFSKIIPQGWKPEMWQPILREVVSALSKHFGTTIELQAIAILSEDERRNLILRITLKHSGNGVPESVIFKQSVTDSKYESDKEAFDRFARDWAGLEFLKETSHTSQFYGGSTTHRFVLLEDLGKHVSLVDSLLGSDAGTAKLALERFVSRLGKFHAESFGKTSQYLEILQRLNPSAGSWQEDLELTLKDTLPRLKSLLEQLGISYNTRLQEEIECVLQTALEPGPFTVFIHGDICPDNVFDNPIKNELRLIDFEWGVVRNALLDGTYLRMCMPTCWCASHIPEELIETLEVTYRNELKKYIPAATVDAAYHTAYAQACGYWMIQSAVQAEEVLGKEESDRTQKIKPRVLSRLQAFIDVSKKYEMLPHLRSIAEQVLNEVKTRWQDAKPLEMYPVFKSLQLQFGDR